MAKPVATVETPTGDFPELVAEQLDRLKQVLVSAYANERKAACTCTKKRPPAPEIASGFCCGHAREKSRGALAVAPVSSWQKPIPEVTEVLEESDAVALEGRSEPEAISEDALARWERFAAAALHGELATKRRVSVPQEFFAIHSQWTSGEHVTGRKTQVARGPIASSAFVLRVKSMLIDDSHPLQRLVSHPDGLVRLAWLCFGMFLIFWDCLTIPLVLADADEETQNFLFVVSHFTVGFWGIDLFYNFFTGYDTGAGIEMRPPRIAVEYCRTWLLPDIILVVIEMVIKLLEIIAYADSEELTSIRVLRAVRVLRFLRLLRLQKISRIGEVIAKHFTSVTFWLSAKIASGIVFILVVNHYFALCFMGIGMQGRREGTVNWLETYSVNDYGFWDTYAISLHWSLTQFTPATNNVGPISVSERLFAIGVVVVALALFSSFLSSITNAVTALRSVRLNYASQEAQIRQFFNERNLPAALLAQVKAFMHLRSAAIHRMREKDVKLLAELPDHLKQRLHAEMYLMPVMSLPWWPGFMSDGSDYLEKVCHKAASERIATPGVDIFVPDGKCEGCIMPVAEGGLIYTRRELFGRKQILHGATGVAALSPSDRVAEIGLWAVWKYRGHLTSEATCPYIFIDSEAFSELTTSHGGSTFKFLQIFGLLYISHVEDHMEKGQLTDLAIDDEVIEALKTRTEFFMDVAERGGPGRSFSCLVTKK